MEAELPSDMEVLHSTCERCWGCTKTL